MKRAALGFFLALAACPEKEGAEKTVPLPPAAVARLVSKEGTVTLTRTKVKAPAEEGALLENDVLETAQASKALLRAPGGREIELGENTQFTVHANLGEIEVGSGSITFVADDEGDGGVTAVITRYGRTTVAPGTRGSLVLGQTGLTVDVAFGGIVQEEEDGGTRRVGAGQRFEFGVGGVQMVEDPLAEAVDVQLSADGRVLLKKSPEKKFTPAKKGAQRVDEGTAFQVSNGARAKLAAGPLTVKLPAGTNGSLDTAAATDDGSSMGLTANGEVGVAFDGKGPAAVNFNGKVPLKVKGRTEAAVTVSKGRIVVTVGEVELEVNGKKQVVKAGEEAVATPKGIEVGPRPRPPVVVPLGKKVRVYSRRALGEVALQLPDDLSRAQVANDAAFTDVVVSGPSRDYVAVSPPATGELYWRALDEKGQPSATGRVRFLTDTGGAKDEASRADTVAETGKRASVFFQAAVPTLTFTWAAVDGAKGYLFRIYRGKETKALVEKKSAEPKVTVEPGLLSEGSFQWTAAALDEAGNEKSGSRANQMDIVYDNSLTTLQIASPKDGERADAAKVAGTAPLNAKLFVNGRPVPLDGSGRFSAPAPRVELLVFRLVAADGSESYWFRRLKR